MKFTYQRAGGAKMILGEPIYLIAIDGLLTGWLETAAVITQSLRTFAAVTVEPADLHHCDVDH